MAFRKRPCFIAHLRQGQTGGRGRDRGHGPAVAGGQELWDARRVHFSLAASGQQACHIAHHLLQKTVGGDAEKQHGAVRRVPGAGRGRLQAGVQHRAHCAFHIRARIAQTGEVAAAQQVGQGRVQGRKVQRAAVPDKGRQGRGTKARSCQNW